MSCALDLIEQSPMKLLLQHMKDVQLCVGLLRPFIQAINNKDWPLAEKIFQDVVCYEHAADKKKLEFRQLLRKDLILQVSKSELLKIIIEQDKMANFTRDTCGLLLWRRNTFPSNLQSKISEFISAVVKTCELAMVCLEVAATTIDAVFRKDCKHILDDKLFLLEESESETDDLQCQVRSLLMAKEKDYSAVQMICFYDIVRNMGSIADQAELYGHLLFVCVSD